MRFTKKTVWTAIVATLVVGLIVTVGVGVGVVRLWPVARTWVQNAMEGSDIEAARRAVAQAGAKLGDDHLVQLSRTREGMVVLAALAGNPELAAVLKLTAAIPALGPLLQNGGYGKALEEAIRQNVPHIAQIRLDEVASPETRALLQEVQQVIARNPQAADAASTVDANLLRLLKSEAFLLLSQNPDFSRVLSGQAGSGVPEPDKEIE